MTLFEILFLIMLGLLVAALSILIIIEVLNHKLTKNYTNIANVYQKNLNYYNDCFNSYKNVIEDMQEKLHKAYNEINEGLINHRQALEHISLKLVNIDKRYTKIEESIRRLETEISSLNKDELQLENKEFFYGCGKPINTEIKEKKHDTRKNRSK